MHLPPHPRKRKERSGSFEAHEEMLLQLDIEIRICIRDSLFRLAQSALRRQYDGDMGNTNRRCGNEASVLVEERLSSPKR